MQSQALISQNVGQCSGRHPLEILALPLEIIGEDDYLPKSHVWWIERQRKGLWLRAKCYVIKASLEQTQSRGIHRLVWELDTQRSERISWPGTCQCSAANITVLSSALIGTEGPELVLDQLPDELDQALENRRLHVSKEVWQLEHADRLLRRLFHDAARELPRISALSFSPDEAWRYLHVYFAREELISVRQRDAFEVASAVLANSTFPCSKIGEPEAATGTVEDANTFGFCVLDHEQAGCIQHEWNRNPGTADGLEAVEKASRRHQEILSTLAREVLAVGLQPTYNRHVDLRVQKPTGDILFEVKTADKGNFQEQIRLAVGQLLEYRFRFRKHCPNKATNLAVVIEANADAKQYDFAESFLREIGISLVLWKQEMCRFDGLDTLLKS